MLKNRFQKTFAQTVYIVTLQSIHICFTTPNRSVFLFHRLKFEFPYKFCVEIYYILLRLISFQTEIIYFILCNWDRNYSEWFDKGTACDLFGVCDWCDNDRIYMVIEKVWRVCVCMPPNKWCKKMCQSFWNERKNWKRVTYEYVFDELKWYTSTSIAMDMEILCWFAFDPIFAEFCVSVEFQTKSIHDEQFSLKDGQV